MNANGYDMTGAARRSLPVSLPRPTYLFSGMFLNCFSIKSSIDSRKVKVGIRGGSGGVNEAAGGSQICQLLTSGCKILAKGIGLTLAVSNYLTFDKYTFRVGFRFSWQELFLLSRH